MELIMANQKYNELVEQRFYDAADWQNDLMDQIDAVLTLTDPEVGTSRGLKPIDAVKICAKIDPKIGAETAEELVNVLKERADAEQDVMDGALSIMESYPDALKADILPELSDRYKELFDRLEDLGDIKVDFKPIETIREVITTERLLNNIYSLVMAHKLSCR